MSPCCAHAIVAACEDQANRIRELEQREPEDVQVAKAQRDEALDALVRVLAILARDGGFRTSRQQATIRGARALVAEVGK